MTESSISTRGTNFPALTAPALTAVETQALLASIIESSHDAIISKRLDGVITSWNRGAERIFGYSAIEAVGKHITLIIPRERLHEEATIIELLRAGERVDHFETLRRTKWGDLIDISLTVSPIRDGAGKIIGASKIARDITLRKKAETALREANQRKDDFLAILSHELRNPLAPVVNAAELLLAKAPPGSEFEWAGAVISRQAQHMVRLIDDLLDVSRINSGKIILRREAVDLAQCIGNAIEANRPFIDRQELELTVAVPSEPISVDGDPIRLSQVFSNLLNNAAKYTDHGGRIRIEAECDSEVATVRVRDTGIGMPAGILENVFRMFMQADESRTRSRGGLGVGLTLARMLVEMHGGSVSATSEGVGCGSEFLVRLPIKATQVAHTSAKERLRSNSPLRRRVLIVDDNEDAANSMALLLGLSDHEVKVVYDGMAAVVAAVEFQPDAVLLDLGLPKLSGHEVARRIRAKLGQNVLLLALTGWGHEKDRQASINAGFNHHLTKPVDVQAVMDLLARPLAVDR